MLFFYPIDSFSQTNLITSLCQELANKNKQQQTNLKTSFNRLFHFRMIVILILSIKFELIYSLFFQKLLGVFKTVFKYFIQSYLVLKPEHWPTMIYLTLSQNKVFFLFLIIDFFLSKSNGKLDDLWCHFVSYILKNITF